MRRCVCCCSRRKWSQRTWAPTSTGGGAAPASGVSAQEALQIAYRPMPLPQTVEYEEDFGHNLMIHREFISKRHRDRLGFDVSALAYSEVELRRGRQHLAGVMNRERRGVSIGAAGAPDDQVHMQTDVDPQTREVTSARYLFNEKRLEFCDRFQNFFQTKLEKNKTKIPNSDNHVKHDDNAQYLFSLMEACAIIYGCETNAARETYYRMFLSLDLDSLEAEDEELRNRIAEAKLVRQSIEEQAEKNSLVQLNHEQKVKKIGNVSIAEEEEAFIASVPELSLIGDDFDNAKTKSIPEGKVRFDESGIVHHTTSDSPNGEGETDNNNNNNNNNNNKDDETQFLSSSSLEEGTVVKLPEEFEEYAPLYRAYLSYAKGESPIASYDVSTLGSTGVIAERRRWRSLMEKIVREDYHKMTEMEQMDAIVLNEQLHTVKFFDLKVGDTVREVLQLLQRETGEGSSLHRDTPIDVSPNHPERRV
ncbi:uncharacterized protein TM35_000053480 [Trypanosoma theileri]|uniref:Uncharacterized protein n=1 Tax=Trypanosoma theileri TaxID=67003 RepID=A0A1X0P4A4_9TRYP|nr:uncharacterized protein TM35_000053480 [Trypanosoma theileri]ORC91752.1 hypothetical protein TM35_000053480 [Trypanosoma theileri]